MKSTRVIIPVFLLFIHLNFHVNGEECDYGNVIEHTLKAGESGVITSPSYPEAYRKMHLVCDVKLNACLNCIIEVTFEDFSLPKCTMQDMSSSITDDVCDVYNLCEYFLINEPKSSEGLKRYEGFQNQTIYTSKTSTVQLRFCYSSYSYGAEERRWKISFMAKENVPTLVGSNTTGILRSQDFPSGYMGGTVYKYLLKNTLPSGIVMVVFDDLDLASDSKIKIYDSDKPSGFNIEVSGTTRGAYVSDTPMMFLELHAGTLTTFKSQNLGFKLTYHFLSEKPDHPELYTYALNGLTDYGYVSKTLGNMIYNSPFDYLWRLIPPKGLRAYIKITDIFTSASSKNWSIKVHEGNNSDGKLLAECQELKNCRNLTSFQLPHGFTSFKGLYLRIQGRFTIADSITFAYAAFSSKSSMNLEDCELEFDNSITKGFYCVTTGRCIPARFKCDSHDHCGDNADEARCRNVAPTPTAKCGWRYECSDGRCVDFDSMCDPCYGKSRCLDGGCYEKEEFCDGNKDCNDGSDEICIINSKEKEMLTNVKGPNLLWLWITLACVTLISVICVAGFIKFRKKGGRSAVYQATENGRPASTGSVVMNGDAQNIRLSQNIHSSYNSLQQNSVHGSHPSLGKHSASITQIVPPMTEVEEPLVKKKEPDEEPLVKVDETEEKPKLEEVEEPVEAKTEEPENTIDPSYEEVRVQILGDKDEAVQSGTEDDAVQASVDEQTKLV